MWWVYVIQSEEVRFSSKTKRKLPGFHYVGCTTDLARRIRQHNGSLVGGAAYTAKHRPWVPRAAFGPYANRSEAQKAERALKHGKRGKARTQWSPKDSKWCCGPGTEHPWVKDPKWKPPKDN